MERTSEMRPENDASVGGLRDDIKALSVLKLCTFLWVVCIVSAEAVKQSFGLTRFGACLPA